MRVNGADNPQGCGIRRDLNNRNGLRGGVLHELKSLVSLLFFSFSLAFAVMPRFGSQWPFLFELHVR